MPGIASSAPAVLAATLAQAPTIRVGSGGVMLPNHAPLVVAEQFGMLEALHPGRIDLGIGRAPGTDQVTTALALRRQRRRRSPTTTSREQLAELIAFFSGEFPPSTRTPGSRRCPARATCPPIWLLGSSGYSAQLAGMLGLPFSFAHHFSPEEHAAGARAVPRSFRPSERLAEPLRDGRRRSRSSPTTTSAPAGSPAPAAVVPPASPGPAEPDARRRRRPPATTVTDEESAVAQSPASADRRARDRARSASRSWRERPPPTS